MIRSLLRVGFTLAVAALAVYAGWRLWDLYVREPWTRDARVRADVVSIAPDVSGAVDLVAVADNSPVRAGDLLFRIDQSRFAIALARAEAAVSAAQSTLDQAQVEFDRDDRLSGVVSEKVREEARSAFTRAQAEFRGALAARDAAKLDLQRTEVRAPVNGIVTNLTLRPGEYVKSGSGVVALVDTDTFRVEAYFEETKLPRVGIGAPASVHLMGQPGRLTGHVESIAGGIADRERSDGAGGLANVNPSFAWVRLAQRVPVRIALDAVPAGQRLVSGTTASVAVGRPAP